MLQKVNEMLNFDDGVFAEYTRGPERLSVYIAYWKPGKISRRLVTGHTPDTCWVSAGWETISSVRAKPLIINKRTVLAIEARVMKIHSTTEYVWFWHTVNGKIDHYGPTTTAPWYAFFFDLFEHGLNQRDEQFFIRLSSPQPLDCSALAPVLECVLHALPLQTVDK